MSAPITFDFTESTLDPLLSTVARIFAHRGDGKTVLILAESKPSIEQIGYDNWNGGTTSYMLQLHVPHRLYSQIESERDSIERSINDVVRSLIRACPNDDIDVVQIAPELEVTENWRERASNWSRGEGISNQGRVRSNNIAARSHDGLLFRSQPEIFLYDALKVAGVTFAPLPVFLRGGAEYRRIEPDFVILKDGILMIVEVDGDTVHTESPLEAHNRTTLLRAEGAHVERVSAGACDTSEKAVRCAAKLLERIAKIKATI